MRFSDQVTSAAIPQRGKPGVAIKHDDAEVRYLLAAGSCCWQHSRELACPCRGSVRLYTEFFDSDIIVASPLALASQLGEGKEGAADFLASIEIALVDRCDVMQMQNWSHVVTGEGVPCKGGSCRQSSDMSFSLRARGAGFESPDWALYQ